MSSRKRWNPRGVKRKMSKYPLRPRHRAPNKCLSIAKGHLFLPWREPVSLREGEICSVELHSNLVGNDYVWRWETDLPASSAHGQLCFRQSTFYGSLFPPSLLKKRTMDFVPLLNESGQAERWILQAMDGKRPLEAIAAEAARLFPHVFRRVEDAFNQAAEIAEKYSR